LNIRIKKYDEIVVNNIITTATPILNRPYSFIILYIQLPKEWQSINLNCVSQFIQIYFPSMLSGEGRIPSKSPQPGWQSTSHSSFRKGYFLIRQAYWTQISDCIITKWPFLLYAQRFSLHGITTYPSDKWLSEVGRDRIPHLEDACGRLEARTTPATVERWSI
jgi:hypothetical protein